METLLARNPDYDNFDMMPSGSENMLGGVFAVSETDVTACCPLRVMDREECSHVFFHTRKSISENSPAMHVVSV